MNFENRLGRLLAVTGLLFILVATLHPIPGGGEAAVTTSFWCLVCGSRGAVDVTLNVILFVPFALGLRLAGWSRNRVIALCVLLTIFVEVMQVRAITGRDASLSDLLTNTTGGVIGATLAPRLRMLALPPPRLGATLAVVWAIAWLAMLATAAWLLHPWSPTRGLRVGWGIRVPGYGQFSGRVISASAGDMPLDPGPAADSVALHRALAAGEFALQLHAIVGPQGNDWAPIVALVGRYGPVAAVYDVHDDLILEFPTNATKLRFRSPALRLDGGRPPAAGEPIRVTAGTSGRALWIASSYGGERRRRELAMSPSFGWSLVLPFEYAFGPEVNGLTALWVAGWLLPIGYWARWARWALHVRPYLLIGLAIVLALGLGLLPRVTGYPPVAISEWIAGILGLAVGWAVASRATYLAGRCASSSTSESYSS